MGKKISFIAQFELDEKATIADFNKLFGKGIKFKLLSLGGGRMLPKPIKVQT